MKKVIAIVLAVVMTFSLGLAAFASDLTVEQEAGKFIIVAQNEHIEAGKDYTIPVSVVSNLTQDDIATNDTSIVCTGFFVAVGGFDAQYVEITDFQLTDQIKNSDGFSYYDNGFTFGDIMGDGSYYCAFQTKDTSILNSANYVIANVTIHVSDSYTGNGEDVADENLTDAILDIGAIDLSWGQTDATSGASAVITDGVETALTSGSLEDQVLYNAGHLSNRFSWDPEPEMPFLDRVKVWFLNLALKITNGIGAIMGVLSGLIEGELAKY